MGQGSTLVVAKDIVLVLLATTMGRNVMTFIFRDKQMSRCKFPCWQEWTTRITPNYNGINCWPTPAISFLRWPKPPFFCEGYKTTLVSWILEHIEIREHLTKFAEKLIVERLFYTIWVRSRNCGCLVTWFCYQLIAKPGNKTAAVSWPDPYLLQQIKEHPAPFSHCINSQTRLTIRDTGVGVTTWLLIGWQLCYQTIRCQVLKSL